MTSTQDQLFDTFLDDACANLTSAGILAPPHTCDSVAELCFPRDRGGFLKPLSALVVVP